MPSTVYLVRHAEGLHNLGQEYWTVPDPLLTDKGKEQCLKLQENFPYHTQVQLVVSSPLCRTIYTAAHGFRPVFERQAGTELILLPDLQEISDFPCDIGSEVSTLRKRTEDIGLNVNWSFVHEGWTSKDGRYEPTIQAIRSRARSVRRWLNARPEKEIVVVSHGAFLHFLTEDWEDSCTYEGTGWTNTEYRSYEIKTKDEYCSEDPSSHNDDATLIETAESRYRRGKTNIVPTNQEQISLYEMALREWEQQGYLLKNSQRDSIIPKREEISVAA